MLTHCHGCSHWTFVFYLVANADFHIRMILVYLVYALATRIEIKIELSFTQRVGATLARPKMPIKWFMCPLGSCTS